MRFLAALACSLLLIGCADRAPSELPAAVPLAEADTAALNVNGTVIYELYVRSFTPEGTFQAIIPRLDELRDLGVDILWLMPIHPVGEVNRKGTLGSPYSIQDYEAVNPRFGTLDDFRALVDAVHERDMKVILDLVANHTAFDHAWVTDHPAWYTKDSTGAVTHPEGTDWTDVADLDYSQPGVRVAMRDGMRFWVEEIGVDGYRCDVAELVPLDFWREAIAELRAIKPVVMLAEGAAPELYEAGFDLTYAWETYGALKAIWNGASADTLAIILDQERARYGDAARMRFTTNHDETAWDATPLDLFGGTEGAQAAAVIAATLPGAFLVYNGQEVGDTQQLPLFEQVAVDWDTDPEMRDFYADLLAQRAASAALREGGFESIEHAASDDAVVFVRTASSGETVRVGVNVRDRPATVVLGEDVLDLEPYGWQIDLVNRARD